MTERHRVVGVAAALGLAASPASACGPTGEILLILAALAAAGLMIPILGMIATVRIRRKGFSWRRAVLAGAAALGETGLVLTAGAGSLLGLACLGLLALKAVVVSGPLGSEDRPGVTSVLTDERLYPTL